MKQLNSEQISGATTADGSPGVYIRGVHGAAPTLTGSGVSMAKRTELASKGRPGSVGYAMAASRYSGMAGPDLKLAGSVGDRMALQVLADRARLYSDWREAQGSPVTLSAALDHVSACTDVMQPWNPASTKTTSKIGSDRHQSELAAGGRPSSIGYALTVEKYGALTGPELQVMAVRGDKIASKVLGDRARMYVAWARNGGRPVALSVACEQVSNCTEAHPAWLVR